MVKLNVISVLFFCISGFISGCNTTTRNVDEVSIHHVGQDESILPAEENETIEIFTKRTIKIDTFESDDTNYADERETNELTMQVIEVDSTQITGNVISVYDINSDQLIYNHNRESLVKIDTSEIDFIRKVSRQQVASRSKGPNKFGHYHNYPYNTPDFVSKADDDACGRIANRKALESANEISEAPARIFGVLGAIFVLGSASSKMNSTYEKEMKSCLRSMGYDIPD